MSRVTCSVREVGEFVNIPKSTAYRALKSLTDKGFLVQVLPRHAVQDARATAGRRSTASVIRSTCGTGVVVVPAPQAYAYKHFVEGRDSPAWEWVHHRGVCIWGQGLAPTPVSSWPLSIGT